MKPSKDIQWIWFDLDDTLYDFSGSSLIALRHIYDKYNLGRFFPDKETWIDIYHKHNTALWKLYNQALVDQPTLRYRRFYLPLIEVGASHEVANELVWPLDRDYLDTLGSTGMLLPGAREALEHLRKKVFRIGILSNGFNDVQHQKIRSSAIEPFIDCIVLSDEAGFNKPDPRIFDFALHKSGAIASESLMIGDNPETDIAGAANAGWHTLFFDKNAAEPFPSGTINSLSALLNW